jgi:hypothetical protein
MAVGFVTLPADSTGKKERTYDYGAEGHLAYVIPNPARIAPVRFSAGTWAIATVALAATQNLATIANATGSTVLVALQSSSPPPRSACGRHRRQSRRAARQ